MNKKFQIRIWQVIVGAVLIGAAGLSLGMRHPEWSNKLSHQAGAPDFSSLTALYQTLQTKYDGQIDPSKVLDGAKAGLVSAAGDPYTTYLTSGAMVI